MAREVAADHPGGVKVNRQSQCGLGLSAADAAAFCGPNAAMELASFDGHNIPLEAVKTAAQANGWSPSLGMAGPGSEVNLLNRLGLNATMEAWNPQRAQQLLAQGTPIILDTPGHYFLADAFDPARGYRVSADKDLRRGSEWMTPEAMAALMGNIRNLIYHK